MPGSGRPADPGLASMVPGRVVIMIAPVSVCHQVSTIGQRPPPTTFQYHSQAFGLIGSPTVPSSRSEDTSCFATCSDRKSTRLNSSHANISYAVFCLKKIKHRNHNARTIYERTDQV